MTRFLIGRELDSDSSEESTEVVGRSSGDPSYQGLCALCAACDRRHCCMFPLPAIGFWDCDRFQRRVMEEVAANMREPRRFGFALKRGDASGGE